MLVLKANLKEFICPRFDQNSEIFVFNDFDVNERIIALLLETNSKKLIFL